MSARPTSTDAYRKYPKGPNFLGIVLGACAFLLVAFLIVYFILHRDAGKMMPHGPSRTPNAVLHLGVLPKGSTRMQAAA